MQGSNTVGTFSLALGLATRLRRLQPGVCPTLESLHAKLLILRARLSAKRSISGILTVLYKKSSKIAVTLFGQIAFVCIATVAAASHA